MSIFNFKPFWISFGLLFLTSHSSVAQELRLTKLEEVIRFAKSQAPEQKIRELRTEEENYVLPMSKAELLPSLRAYSTWDNYLQLPVQLLPSEAVGGEPGTFTEIRFGTQYQINLGFEASFPLFDLELWNKIKTDRLRSEMNLRRISVEEQVWIEEIAKRYYQLLLHQESLRLAERRFHLSDSIYRLANITQQTGEMEPLPFQRIQASALSAQHARIKQKKQTELVQSSLKRLIGARDTAILFTGNFQTAHLDKKQLSYELTIQPEWRRAELEVSMAEQLWKQSRFSHLPKITANGRFYQQTLANNFNLSDASSFEVGLIGLSLNWNIFQGNFKRLKTKKAYLDFQIAKEQQILTQLLLEEERYHLETELSKNQILADKLVPIVELYEDNYRLAGIQWAEGLIAADELLQVEREWIGQQQEYLAALSDLLTSRALLAIRNQIYSEIQ